MIFNRETTLITTVFVTYLTTSVNSAAISSDGRKCRDNIYLGFGLNIEDSSLKREPRKLFLRQSFQFKLLSTLSTDEAKMYYKEISKNIIPNDTENPRRYCERVTLETIYGISKYSEYIICMDKLLRSFLDSDEPVKVLRYFYFNQVQSHFENLHADDYSRRYFNHMAEQIGYSYQLHTPLKLCEENIKKAKNAKKRSVQDSETELSLTSSKRMKPNSPSSSDET